MTVALALAAPAAAQDVVVYYANGILSTPQSRDLDRLALKARVLARPELSGLSLRFKLAENESAGFINDLVEGADQLGLRAPTVVDLLQGQLVSRALGTGGAGGLALLLVQATADLLAGTPELALLQGTTLDNQLNSYRRDLITSGVVIVAHSQGNLFTRDSQAVLMNEGLVTFAVPVGPPDLPPQMVDPQGTRYTLLQEDVVINFAARNAALAFGLTLPPVANEQNSFPPFALLRVPDCLLAALGGVVAGRDCLYHRFVEDYLEPQSNSEARILDDVSQGILLAESVGPTESFEFAVLDWSSEWHDSGITRSDDFEDGVFAGAPTYIETCGSVRPGDEIGGSLLLRNGDAPFPCSGGQSLGFAQLLPGEMTLRARFDYRIPEEGLAYGVAVSNVSGSDALLLVIATVEFIPGIVITVVSLVDENFGSTGLPVESLFVNTADPADTIELELTLIDDGVALVPHARVRWDDLPYSDLFDSDGSPDMGRLARSEAHGAGLIAGSAGAATVTTP